MAMYGIHLPESWWAQCASTDLSQQMEFLARRFPGLKVAVVPRSHHPILTNDPLYQCDHVFDPGQDQLMGPVFKDDLVYAMLGESKELADAARISASLNWEYERIEALDLNGLLEAPRIKQHREQADSIRQAGKRPWGWINVPGILQVGWTLRGDAFLGDLQQGKTEAIGLLESSVEIIRRGYALHVYSFDQPKDARLLHMPLCFLGMAGSPELLARLKPYYLSVRDYVRGLNGGLCRVHICFVPDDSQQDMLCALGIDEFEAPEAWAGEMAKRTSGLRISNNWVHLLDANAFSADNEERNRVENILGQGADEVCLYDMNGLPDEAFMRECLS